MAALFFDIDGTLLSEELGRIPESAIEGLLKAKEKGHRIFINTGRTFCDVPEEIRKFPFDGYCCGCGTHLIYQGEVLLEHSIPYERGVALIEQMQKCGIEAVLEGVEDVYFQEAPYCYPWLEEYRVHMQGRNLGKTALAEEKNFSFDKFIMHTDEQCHKEAFFAALEEDMLPIPCGDNFYECVQKGYSKATAVAFFEKYLSLTLDEMYVFGDGGNDEAMFAYAKHTIALKKHAAILDPLTEYVTDTMENDGIYKALVHYGLI